MTLTTRRFSTKTTRFRSPMAIPFDAISRGVHLYNVTTRIHDDRLQFTGVFSAAELLPVLVFSVGVPWVKPCVDSICCLWEVALRYRDDDLIAAIGKTCDRWMNFTGKNMMKGSEVTAGEEWRLTTRVHPNFVAMLFLCLTPTFYMYYEIVPIQWVEKKSVAWSASWYGAPCHTVQYPDGKEVCIHCSNSKPEHSTYIFSADWFQTFECRWQCHPGYTGPNCDMSIDTAVFAGGSVFIVLCVAGIVLAATRGRTIRKGVKPAPPMLDDSETPTPEEPVPLPRMMKSEMIAFKDNAIGEIRIKFL